LKSVNEKKNMKIPDCNRCQFYAHQLYIVCALHPNGVEQYSCLDFRPLTDVEEESLWAPDDYSYYNGELIPNIPPLTRQQQEDILNHHPLFTGFCPNCGQHYEKHPVPSIWDCTNCGWSDEWGKDRKGR